MNDDNDRTTRYEQNLDQRGKRASRMAMGGKVRDDAEESERSVTAGILPLGAHRLADHG